jgi:hypothetical protein
MSDMMGLPGSFGSSSGFTDFGVGIPSSALSYEDWSAQQRGIQGGNGSLAQGNIDWRKRLGADIEREGGLGGGLRVIGFGGGNRRNRRVDTSRSAYEDYLSGLAGDTTGTAAGQERTPYDWMQSPAYQFRLSEGLRALNRAAGAMGNRLSGSRLLGLQEYGQQSATQEFGNQYQRLAGLAGFGQGATNVGVQAGQQSASNIGNLLSAQGAASGAGALAAGQYSGAGTLNAARSLAGGLSSIGGFFGGGAGTGTGAGTSGRALTYEQAMSGVY